MSFNIIWWLFVSFYFFLWQTNLHAIPFLEADNRWLRSDVQNLSDAGVINTPVTQWPIMWVSVAQDLEKADLSKLSNSEMNSYVRVQKAYRRASNDLIKGHISVTSATEASVFREFGDNSREKAELEGSLDWVGKRSAVRIQLQAVSNASDGEDFRADGSYLGYVWGDWVFSAGVIDRWWGPGWKSSMILSNNARPIPALSIQRHHSKAFNTPWLSWIGSWTSEIFLGKLEADRAVPNALIWGARTTFKPNKNLEIGLSRTAIWGGEGRSNSLSTFGNILLSVNENGGQGLTGADDPSNQQAGFDAKWRLTRTEVPIDAYMQYIGDDKLIDGIPSKAIILYGIEAGQINTNWGDYRLFLEYANTTPSGFKGIRTNNSTYEHSIYQSGYRYRRRSLGASFDNDSEVYTLGIIASNHQDQELSLNYSYMNLNRDGSNRVFPAGNPITSTQLKLNTLEARYRYYLKRSYIDFEASFYDKTFTAYNLEVNNRLSLSYRYEF